MRIKTPSLVAYPCQYTHDLRYADADMNGHINNGLFGSLMETNRCLMLLKIQETGQTTEERATTTTVIARFEIDYLKELHFPGRVTSASGVETIGGASFVLLQALFSQDQCVAIAHSTIVMMNTTTRRGTRINDQLRAELGNWMMASS